MNAPLRLCRDCGKRTKPIKHGVGWCNVNDASVPLGIPTPCDAYAPRGKAPLPDPSKLQDIRGCTTESPPATTTKTTTAKG